MSNFLANNIIVKYIKHFLSWIFSNLLWTIVSFIVPFGFIIPFVKNLIKGIINKKIVFSLSGVVCLLIFFIAEQTVFIIFWNIKKSQKNNNINTQNAADTTITITDSLHNDIISDNSNIIANNDVDEYADIDYYFEEYNKQLTIYKNGHGIMITSFKLVINDIDSIQTFRREINIGDSQVDAFLPKLSVMKKTPLSQRFKKHGFWCKCLNNDKLIDAVEEHYWSDKENEIDLQSQNDPKILKWILKINTSSVKIGIPYNVVYVISLPQMFPIVNGYFSENIANIKHTFGKYTSEFSTKHKVKNFSQTISFENGFRLQSIPHGEIISSGSSRNITFINDNNIIFDKYIFNAQNIDEKDIIKIQWFFKESHKTQKGRRNNNDKNH